MTFSVFYFHNWKRCSIVQPTCESMFHKQMTSKFDCLYIQMSKESSICGVKTLIQFSLLNEYLCLIIRPCHSSFSNQANLM